MKVAFIAPSARMEEYAGRGGLVFVLAHEFLRSPIYAEAVCKLQDLGHEMILDNGAYEFGASVQAEDLERVARIIEPQYLILPDIRFDTKATLALADRYRLRFCDLAENVLGVPQGSNREEIRYAYERLSNMDGISGFGIYEEIGDVSKSALGSRYWWLQDMVKDGLIDTTKYHHMLGMEEDTTRIRDFVSFDFVNSIDSCKPVVWGLNGVPLEETGRVPYAHRPKGYFDLVDNPYPDVLEHNVRLALEYAEFEVVENV